MKPQNITLDFLEKLSNKENKNSLSENKKILCIIEGNLELRYIIKIFKILGFQEDCLELTKNLVKVGWGKKFPPNINLVDEFCKFKGGSSIKGSPVPKPAMEAFEMYKSDDNTFSPFSGVIVMFDGDKDKNKEVENYFRVELSKCSIDNCLLVSTPCFESTLIDYCKCGHCRNQINSIPATMPPCKKFKDNFSNLNCFSSYSNSVITNERVKGKGLIANLDYTDINRISSPLSCIHELIKKIK